MSESREKRFMPLRRSITFGCVVFIALLCIVLGFGSHITYKKALYQRYEAYITDILDYVDRHIDDTDLVHCIETLERSEKYDELLNFMDAIKEDFDIHYLYIIKPLNINPTGNCMSVISAENYYDRYIDTEGNLYLGWISDDEFGVENVKLFFSIMEKKNPVFFEEATEWGVDYTGAMTLFDQNNKPYALLAVDVDITEIRKLIKKRTLESTCLIILLGMTFTAVFLLWTMKNVVNPIKMLEKSVVAFAAKSHGQRSTTELTFEPPHMEANNEVKNLSDAMTQMSYDMKDYIDGIVSAEKKAEDMKLKAREMSELAHKDALTGIRNKTAYDSEIKKMEYELSIGELCAFGIAMIDLNFLKKINDTYGHEKGNYAIKKLCHLICTIFDHSPVFRIGGDEFVVILKGEDYDNATDLELFLQTKLYEIAKDTTLEPWEKVSAAVGIAFYDKKIDSHIANVFKRADQKMYECKKQMKAVRQD